MNRVHRSLAIVVVAVSTGLAICSRDAVAGTLRIVHSIDFPPGASSESDLAWDGEHLWVSVIKPAQGLTFQLLTSLASH